MIGKEFIDSFLGMKRVVALVLCRATAKLGVGQAQVALLRELGRSGAATQATLARATMIDPSAAGRTFTAMARKGWIRRKRGREDRRESYVELTASGKRLVAQVEAVYAETAATMGALLDARDVAALERIRVKLAPLAE